MPLTASLNSSDPAELREAIAFYRRSLQDAIRRENDAIAILQAALDDAATDPLDAALAALQRLSRH